MLPLSDTLVLDLTQVIAGPTAGQILGDMGADVIKVEPINGEHFRPHFGGAWVPSMNRNKRGLALDLRTEGGRDVLMRLVRQAAGIAFARPRRHKTGRGQRLDLSLFDVSMHMMSHWITNHGLTGEDPVRMGTSNSILCPLRVFPTRTQPIFIAGTNDAFWRLLCSALGKHDWLADRRFAANADRVANRAILEPMIEEYFLQHTCDE